MGKLAKSSYDWTWIFLEFPAFLQKQVGFDMSNSQKTVVPMIGWPGTDGRNEGTPG